MKKISLAITLIILLFCSCQSKSKHIKELYANGSVKCEYDTLYGKKVGKYIEYYQNGKKSREINYFNGKIEGKYIEYYENGKKSLEMNYSNDIENGKYIEYYQSGRIKEKGELVKGKGCGFIYDYNDKGKLDSARQYILIYPNKDLFNNNENSPFIYDEENADKKSSYLNTFVELDENEKPIIEKSFKFIIKFNKDTIDIKDSIIAKINFINQTEGKKNPFEVYLKKEELKKSYLRIIPQKNLSVVFYSDIAKRKGLNYFQGFILEHVGAKDRYLFFKETYFVK